LLAFLIVTLIYYCPATDAQPLVGKELSWEQLPSVPFKMREDNYIVLHGLENAEAYLYVLVFSTTWTQHLQDIGSLFRHFAVNRLKNNSEISQEGGGAKEKLTGPQ
jgi:hypothetical protein